MEKKKIVTKIRKRDGRVVSFDKQKIVTAIYKAGRATGEFGKKEAEKLATSVTRALNKKYDGFKIPTVEEIQDIVEETLMKKGWYKTARAYILYRGRHAKLRRVKLLLRETTKLIKDYIQQTDWRVKENANMAYSLQGLNNHIASSVIARYWLQEIYPPKAAQTHIDGDFHIHDLGFLGAYCCGWDLYDLLVAGFKGVPGKIQSRPAKHFRVTLGQAVNFLYTMQGESAGAQALSNFDTLLAPFIAYDGLDYPQVKQAMQEFLYNMNVPTRVGFQSPFTNLTFDLTVPSDFANQPVIIGGKPQKRKYAEFQKEMDMLNRAFAEVMLEGDARERVFTFPIPTFNLTPDFDWDNPTLEPIFEMSAKYGIPYWANFVNSDMKPEETRSMCCRLRLDLTELIKRGGGYFGANALTGSAGVVTLNMPRIGYLAKSKKSFLTRVGRLMDIAQEALEVKRKIVERFTERGLYPYSRFYLRGNKERLGGYWSGHFSTIGLNGLNEGLLNLMDKNIASEEGREFAEEVLEYMRKKLVDYQKETGNLYNLEATPAEGSLAPEEKVLVAQSDPQFAEIGPLIDQYLEENREKIILVGASEVLKIPQDEMFTWGFNRKTLEMKKYPVTALVRHPGKSMYELETVSGRKVKVTGQHSVFSLNSEGLPEEVLVSNLERGTAIAIPKKIKMEEIYKEFNLVKLFKNSPLVDKLYGIFPLDFIEELIAQSEAKIWATDYYQFAWKDIKFMWRKNKVVPLKLIYDLKMKIKKEILKSSQIFYRKSKNTKPIKALIPINKKLGFIIGSLLVEGWLAERIEFVNADKSYAEELFKAISDLFGRQVVKFSSQERKLPRKRRYIVYLGKMASLFLEKVGLRGKSDQKKIPGFLFFSSPECTKGVLKGFYLGDGNFWQDKKKNDASVRLYTNSKELIEGLNLLLLRLGILAKIIEEEKRKKSWKKNFIISITGAENLNRFFELVLGEKLEKGKVHSRREIISHAPQLLKSIMEKHSIKPADIGIWKDCLNRNVRQGRMIIQHFRQIVKKLSGLVNDERFEKLKMLANSDLYWDKVRKIKRLAPPKYVYDLEVDVFGEPVNNFLGGEGLVCLHNTSYRLAKIDKKKYPDIIVANEKQVKKGAAPFYTNSSQFPVDLNGDLFYALKLQDPLQCKYSGGTVFHTYLGERLESGEQVKVLAKKIVENFSLPYFSFTPTFSICPEHGYLKGEQRKCPKCSGVCEIYSRVVGYLRPVSQWNKGKQAEFKIRKGFKAKA